MLGEVLWPAQEDFVRAAESTPWVYFLKARQLGETTIGCAYDGWVARFRDPLARVHLFSRTDDGAIALLEAVRYGLLHLPEQMRLPVLRDTTHEFRIGLSEDERRLVHAYPTSRDPSRGATCTHAHVDEWAAMADPRAVWQSIQPTLAKSCHILTTGQGPQNFSGIFWLRCMAGDIVDRQSQPMAAVFIDALQRPDRTEGAVGALRLSTGSELEGRREYAMTWEDALAGGGDMVFTREEIDAAGVDFRGLIPPAAGRRYVKAWDIGRHKDAAVGTVLDVSEDVFDVVHYTRLRERSYPEIQHEIETVHKLYPGTTVIEKNAAGEAVLENLQIPEHELEGFQTTKPSKLRILQQLKLQLQQWCLKWDARACAELDAEMRGYQLPDNNIVQDSVISLAIAVEFAGRGRPGTIGRIFEV